MEGGGRGILEQVRGPDEDDSEDLVFAKLHRRSSQDVVYRVAVSIACGYSSLSCHGLLVTYHSASSGACITPVLSASDTRWQETRRSLEAKYERREPMERAEANANELV